MAHVLAGLAKAAARPGFKPMYALPAAEARAQYAKGSEVLELPKPAMQATHEHRLSARDGAPLALRQYVPNGFEAAGSPSLLFFHGGGFTVGSVNTHDGLCRQLAQRSGAQVLSLDYRLAPEARFPTAVHDAFDALAWLHINAAALGVNAKRVAVGGDSAGGTLATVCALMARDAALPLALQLLIYPACAEKPDSASHAAYAHGHVLERAHVNYFADQYAPPEHRSDWRYAPLLAPDLAQVAPAWFCMAELDPLFDEGMAYADALRMAGVPVDLHLAAGVTHEFIKMGRALPEAATALDAAAAALSAI